MRSLLVAFIALAVAAATGCSSPATITTTAAWSVPLSSGPSGTCSVPSFSFGAVTASTVTPIASQPGADSIEFTTCLIQPAADGAFSVSTSTTEAGGSPNQIGFEIAIQSISPDASPESPSTGEITFISPATGQQALEGTCNFFFRNPGPNAQGVGTGRFWAAYTCPSLTLTGGSAETCAVTEGDVAYQNCASAVYL